MISQNAVARFLKREHVSAYLQIVLGCLLGGASYPLFLSPNYIAPGGLTGIATVLNYLFQWPIGTISLLMNIPLFIISWHNMGRSFVFRSLLATVLFSLMIDILPLKPMTNDPLLASIFGGVLLGAGLGLVIRGGATTGGTDMAARMLHKRQQHITVGTFLFIIDCISVLAAGITIKAEYALYAFIAIFISDKVLDFVMLGTSRQRACYVISNQSNQICDQVLKELERGVTILEATGGYSGEKRPVLLCLLSAPEVTRLKRIVYTCDPTAFLFVTEAHEVLGEGFHMYES